MSSLALSLPESELTREKNRRLAERNMPPKLRKFGSRSRYKALYGGRGGMKSHHFAERVLRRAVEQLGLRWVFVREVQKSLSYSVKQLLEDKINALGLKGFRILATHIETPGDGVFLFQGMQNRTADSMKSLEGFDGAWVEEAQTLSATSLELLRPTIRKEGSEIWCSWNPRDSTDPIDVFFRGPDGPPPDTIMEETSYLDNPYLPQFMRNEIEWDLAKRPEQARHVWGGDYRHMSEARVFKNWRVEEFDTPEGVAFLFGGDWGFGVDPTVLLRMYLINRTLYLDHEAYMVGCDIIDTPGLFDGLLCGVACGIPVSHATVCSRPRNREGNCDEPMHQCHRPEHGLARKWTITADSARPETLSHVKRSGYAKIQPAHKGPGSIEEGVKFLQGYDIVIHPRCRHAIDEFTYYSWEVDKTSGQVLPILADKKNHVIDSARYAVEPVRKLSMQRVPRGLLR